MNRRFRVESLLWVAIFGCVGVERKNRFDPTTPEVVRQKSVVKGDVSSEDGSPLGTVTGTLVSGERRFDISISEQGELYGEVPSGTYILELRGPRYRPFVTSGLILGPGETRDLGGIGLSIQRGALVGSVTLAGATRAVAAQGVNVVLVERTSGTRLSAQSDLQGAFRISGVPVGDYTVSASRPDYAPAYTDSPLSVTADNEVSAPTLTLYPASAVVQIVANGQVGGRYSSTRQVEVQLLAFVNQLSAMRVSLDPSFASASSGDVEFRQFSASVMQTLRDSDGEQTVYAQFRDASGLVSDVFSAKVVLDREAPTAKALTLDDGREFMTGETARLLASGFDNLSGIRGFILSEDPDLIGAAETSALSTSASVELALTQSFSLEDGDKTVYLAWVDRAGNVAAPTSASIAKDTTPPTMTSVSINAGASITSDTLVSLGLLASDPSPGRLVQLQVSESPAFAGASFEPFVTPKAFSLGSSNGAHTVYARVKDGAGLVSGTVSTTVVVDTIAPSITAVRILPTAAAGYTNEREVSVEVTAIDNLSFASDLELAIGDPSLDCATADYSLDLAGCAQAPCTGTFTNATTLSPGDGEKKIAVCARDRAGLFTPVAATATIIFDETPPAAVPSVVASAASRRATVSFALLADNSVASYELDVSSDPGFVAITRTLPNLSPSSPIVVVDQLDNRTNYYFRVRAIDLAGNVGPNSTSASTIVGVAGGRLPLTMTGARDPWFFGPRLLVDEGRLWLSTRDYLLRFNEQYPIASYLLSCSIKRDDCRLPSSWKTALTPSGKSAIDPSHTNRHRNPDHPVVGTNTRLYTVGMKESSFGDTRLDLLACEKNRDCAAGSFDGMNNWSEFNLALRTSGGGKISPAVSLTNNGAHLFVAYRTSTVAHPDHFTPEVAICPTTADCSSDTHFTKVALDDAAVGVSNDCLLSPSGIAPTPARCAMDSLASDEGYWLGYRDDLSAQISLATCSMRAASVCASPSDFSTFSIGTGTAPHLAKSTDNLFVAYSSATGGGSVMVAACALESGCDETSDFTQDAILGSAETQGQAELVTRLTFASGALHLTYWNEAAQRIRYLRCHQPDINDCTLASNWTEPMTYADGLPTTAVPDMTFYGPNQIVAFQDAGGALRVRAPFFAAPAEVATGPGSGDGVVTSWPDLAYVDGYAQHYGQQADQLSSTALLTDPTQTTALLSTSDSEDTFVALSSRRNGEQSDPSRTMLTRPHRRVSLTEPNLAYSSASGGVARAFYSIATTAHQIFVYYATGAGPIRDKFVAQCSLADGCPSLEPVAIDSSFPNQGAHLAVSGTRAHLVASSGVTTGPGMSVPGDLVYVNCDLASNCDDPGDWSPPVVLSGSPNIQEEGVRVVGTPTGVAILASTASSGLLGYECDDSAPCTQPSAWRVRDAVVVPSAAMTFQFSYSAPLGFVIVNQVMMGSPGVFVGSTPSLDVAPTLTEVRPPSGLMAAAVDDAGQRFAFMHPSQFNGDTVVINYCEQRGGGSCLGGAGLSARWSQVRFPTTFAFGEQGSGDLRFIDGVLYAAVTSSGHAVWRSCKNDCYKKSQWHEVTLARDARMLAPFDNARAFSMTGQANLVHAYAKRDLGLELYFGGKAVPLE